MNLMDFNPMRGHYVYGGRIKIDARVVDNLMRTAPSPRELCYNLTDAINAINELRRQRMNRRDYRTTRRSSGMAWSSPSVTLIGGVHQESNTILNLYTARQGRVWEDAKYPKTEEFHYGIEIELTTNASKEELMRHASALNLKPYLQIKRDGSIRPTLDSREGFELCLCIPESKLHSVMNDMQKLLDLIKAKVNNSCGLHIHLDMRHAGDDRSKQWEAYLNLKMGQNIIKRSVSKSRHSSKWCRWTTSTDISSARRASSRYRAINALSLFGKKTIEIRAFQSTTDCADIVTYCLMLRKIMLTKNPLKRASNSQATLARIYGYDVVRMMRNMETKYNLAS